MIIKAILMGLFCGKSGKGGIWDYLGKRAESRSRVDLEEVRNKGTREAIQSLVPGMVLREGGPDWVREIRAPGTAASAALCSTAQPIAPGELEPVPQQAQGPADESC